jgi:exodeoxyribonuclease VII small subunit
MPEEPDLPFEEAIAQLEEIVESLERGEPDLAAALVKYETGVRLLTRCHSQLERAERAVALLTGVDEQGRPTTAPFDATATLGKEAPPSASSPPGILADPTQAPAPKPGRPRKSRKQIRPETEADEFGDLPF